MAWITPGGLLLSALLLTAPAAAEVLLPGSPLMQRYGPMEYRATPSLWSVAANTGRLFVASNDGVLVYDGSSWTTQSLPGGAQATFVRRLADGRIFVGGVDRYGILEPDPEQGLRYIDLWAMNGLTAEQNQLGPVWELVETAEGKYIQSMHQLHFLPRDDGPARAWATSEALRSILGLDGQLHARVEGEGLGRFIEGRLQLIPGGETFRDQPVAALLAWGGQRYAVGAHGVWRLGDDGVQRVLPWPGGERLAVHTAVPLEAGGFLLSTWDGELLHVDAELRLRQRVRATEQMILSIARDDEGRLWAVTDTEVLRLDMPSPWSLLSAADGLRGRVFDTAVFDGALWTAGTRSLQRLRPDGRGGSQTEVVPGLDYEAYRLLADRDLLLVGHRDGLYQLRAGSLQAQPLFTGDGMQLLERVQGRSDLAYASGDRYFVLLRRGLAGWEVWGAWPLAGMALTAWIETTPGEVWMDDQRGAPQRWRFDLESGVRRDATILGPAEGLPSAEPFNQRLLAIDRKLLVWTAGGLLRFDAGAGRFVAIEEPPWLGLLEQPEDMSVAETAKGSFVVTPRQLLHRPRGEMQWRRLSVGDTSGFGLPRTDATGTLRIPVWNGVLQYTPNGPLRFPEPLQVGFETLQLRDRDDRYWTTLRPEQGRIRLPSGQPLRLRFGLGSLEPAPQFRYRMAGVVPEFTEWADRNLAIRGLPPGEYLLEVEARVDSGREILPARLLLEVVPRWHQRVWVRVLAAFLLLLAGFAVLRFMARRRIHQIQQRNRWLEEHIALRTAELERANARLAELSFIDPLTATHNRRALESALKREWARSAEQQLPLAAVMVDIDHFKQFNDRYGHLEGDRVLIAVAEILRAGTLAPIELLARYGGEEFTLLIPGANEEQALARAEQLRAAIETAGLGLTLSLGVAVLRPGPLHTNPTELLSQADQALYVAKNQGRNRVVLARS